MKIITVSGCHVCPYIRRKKSDPNFRYCSIVDFDEKGHGVDLADFIDNKICPSWCQLEDSWLFGERSLYDGGSK